MVQLAWYVSTLARSAPAAISQFEGYGEVHVARNMASEWLLASDPKAR
jgi:hypothetical protein